MSEKKKPFYEKVADQIIEQLKEGTAPWTKPWQPGSFNLPHNPISGTRYRGANAVYLASTAQSKGYKDPRWLTYKQASSIDAQVMRGEKGTQVQYWKFSEQVPLVDDNGKPVLDDKGKKQMVSVKLERPKVFSAVVFNGDQIDNMPEFVRPELKWDPTEKAEQILESSGAKIVHDQNDRAFYTSFKDEIHLPSKEQFESSDRYYATALHELGHWTGHEKRLDRELGNPFGSIAYAKEELRAEIASMILGDELGIGHDPGQHVAYIQSWIQVLEEDPKEILRASSDAEKIKGYVMDLDRERSLEADQVQEVSTEAVKSPTAEVSAKLARGKTYIHVPYQEKNEAKGLGARWDRNKKSWYVNESENLEKFSKWLAPKVSQEAKAPESTAEKTYLAVPFTEKNKAKSLGARWDRAEKSWYVPAGTDLSSFSKWMPQNIEARQEAPLDPISEFKQALDEAGLAIKGSPNMDGKLHRVPVIEGKAGSRDGAYVGYLDGHPAGHIENFKTGLKTNWKSKGYRLSNDEKAKLTAEAAQKKADREKAREELYQDTASKIGIESLAVAPKDHWYLKAKEVEPHGIKVDPFGNLKIPAMDAKGKVWSVVTINSNGEKKFLKNSKKKGCFYPLSKDALKGNGPILIAEGFATAATVMELSGKPTISAFDSGNLVAVAQSLREKFPKREILIFGDDDRKLEAEKNKNPGRDKALLAARKVNGKAFFPTFPNKCPGSDFNDLSKECGSVTARRQITVYIEKKLIITRGNSIQKSLSKDRAKEKSAQISR